MTKTYEFTDQELLSVKQMIDQTAELLYNYRELIGALKNSETLKNDKHTDTYKSVLMAFDRIMRVASKYTLGMYNAKDFMRYIDSSAEEIERRI